MLTRPDFNAKQIVLCMAAENQKARIRNSNLIIESENEEGKKEIIFQQSLLKIFSLWIVGPISITSKLLDYSRKYRFPVLFFSPYFRLLSCVHAPSEGNFLLRKKQYTYQGLDIGKHLIANKIENQIRLLNSVRNKSDALKEGIALMKINCRKIKDCQTFEELMGLEGNCSRLFFKLWYRDIEWQGRKPRTKVDFLNTTLDMGYTALFHFIEALLNLYGFDLYQGFYHRNFYQRKSLVCDLMEPFRCIVDQSVLRAYHLRQLQATDFSEVNHKVLLNPSKNKEYYKWLVAPLLERKDDMFLYIQKFYRSFMKNLPAEQYPTFKI
jgi:CRISPR-associated protein Cas1